MDTDNSDFDGASDTGTGSSSGFVIYTSATFAKSSVSNHNIPTSYCPVS